jgi:site-specific DNA recombinase
MRCGQCGAGYTRISVNLFGCAAARNKGPGICTNRLNIRRDTLEASVLDGLKHHLMKPEAFKIFADEFARELNRLRGEEVGRHARLESELARVRHRLGRIVNAIADGVP